MFKDYPEEIYVSRKDSPMILGIEDGESKDQKGSGPLTNLTC
jgi:glucosamine 6-phosphate synthetase-like amidotransferase/phosphosugar isomerase protein